MANPLDTLERYLKQQGIAVGPLLYRDREAVASSEVELTHSRSASPELSAEFSADPPEAFENRLDEDMANAGTWKHTRSLQGLYDRICECQNCALGATRTKFVFGVGNPEADIVVIGEAPGADEDAQGEPFVGRAGQLLTKILEAVELQRSDVYICNILKCRPPSNRVPTPEEVDQCEPYLYKQLEIIKPKFILALGLTAVNTLLKSKFRMADVRGKFFNYQGVRMMVTYHPAALLRNPEWKKSTWDDVRQLRKAYDDYLSSGRLPGFDDYTS